MKIMEQYLGLKKEIYILTFGKVVTCLGAMVWPMMTLILSNKLKMDASVNSIPFAYYEYCSNSMYDVCWIHG